ncbi:MAG: hypothetical protein GX890_06770 [Firmicutes bacterium]|nr:hypothetical protein [Bacillota bacterium]
MVENVGIDGVLIVIVFDVCVNVVVVDIGGFKLVVDIVVFTVGLVSFVVFVVVVGGFVLVVPGLVVAVVGGFVVVPPGFAVVPPGFAVVTPGPAAVVSPGSVVVVSSGMVVSVSVSVPVSSAGPSSKSAAQPQPERTNPVIRSIIASSTDVNEMKPFFTAFFSLHEFIQTPPQMTEQTLRSCHACALPLEILLSR